MKCDHEIRPIMTYDKVWHAFFDNFDVRGSLWYPHVTQLNVSSFIVIAYVAIFLITWIGATWIQTPFDPNIMFLSPITSDFWVCNSLFCVLNQNVFYVFTTDWQQSFTSSCGEWSEWGCYTFNNTWCLCGYKEWRKQLQIDTPLCLKVVLIAIKFVTWC